MSEQSISKTRVDKTRSDLMVDVYESIAKAKDQQLLWAIGRLNEAERILAMVRDASSRAEDEAARAAAERFLVTPLPS